MLTLFIIPSSRTGSPLKCKESFPAECLGRAFVLKDRYIPYLDLRTGLYMYMYEDELLAPDLKEAFPFYMEHNDQWEALSFYRKFVGDDGTKKYYQSMRVFKKGTFLDPENLQPEKPLDNVVRVLDGFIVGQEYGF